MMNRKARNWLLLVAVAVLAGSYLLWKKERLEREQHRSWASELRAKLAAPRAGDYYLFEPPGDSLPYLFRVTGVTDSLLRLQSLAAEPGRPEAYGDLEAVQAALGRTPPDAPGSWVRRADLPQAVADRGGKAAGLLLPEVDPAARYQLRRIWRGR